MHLVDLKKTLTLPGFGTLKPGCYFAEDHNAAMLLHECGGWGDCSIESMDKSAWTGPMSQPRIGWNGEF